MCGYSDSKEGCCELTIFYWSQFPPVVGPWSALLASPGYSTSHVTLCWLSPHHRPSAVPVPGTTSRCTTLSPASRTRGLTCLTVRTPWICRSAGDRARLVLIGLTIGGVTVLSLLSE